MGLLRTTTQFSDYVLKVEFRADELTNSGIFLRTPPKPTNPARDCYELNIAPANNPFPTGSLVGREQVTGFAVSSHWRTLEVEVNRGHIVVKLNEEKVLDYVDPHPLGRGFIGLQHNQGRVEFRNIKLKPLRTEPIFNGRNLEGWSTLASLPDAKFTVDQQQHVLHVKGGPGQLETDRLFGDFVLQFECQTNGKHLNSGVFFRSIPGDKMNGYESQIHNGFKDGDRTKPIDCGTGGIFRRANARRVVPDDHEWFSKTLIAEGPHFAVWVNGFQVTDWTDKRAPNENPRRGLRLEPGSIILQAHDETTDISFRSFRAVEMAERWKSSSAIRSTP